MAKKAPGKINFGTPPPGTGGYLAAELFKSMSGADMTIIPYKGTAALTTDLLGGHVPVGFNVIAPAMGSLQSGGLRAIATAGPARTGLFPDVPTVDESGLPGFEAVLHYGLLAPAGTPKEIIERLNKELRALVSAPEVRERIAAEGGDPLPSSPQAICRRHRPRGSQVVGADQEAQPEGRVSGSAGLRPGVRRALPG